MVKFRVKIDQKFFMSCPNLRPLYFTLYFCDWIFAFPKTITLSDCGLLASKSSLRSSNSPPRAIKVTFDALEPSSRPLSWIFHYLSPIKLDFREFLKISDAYENLRNFKELSSDKLGSKEVNLSSFQAHSRRFQNDETFKMRYKVIFDRFRGQESWRSQKNP